MGEINEVLRLTDAFTQTFRSFNEWGNRSVQTLQEMDFNLSEVMNQNGQATVSALREIHETLLKTNTLISGNAREQAGHTREVERTTKASNNLLGVVRNLAIVSAGIHFAKEFVGLSDTFAGINARINAINDGMQTTADLTEMIYQSAQRSRASYIATASSIAQMGANAGSAFSSNRELVTFMELINKQFVLSGTDAQLAQSAMLQLSQAMASGALRGQDLNSILQAAPAIARRIESSMGWAEGSIKQYAEQGLVTAEVVKNAMLGSADDINAAFAEMPLTVGQAMTQVKNSVQDSMEEAAASFSEFFNSDQGQQLITELINGLTMLAQIGVWALQMIGNAFLWLHDNMNIVLPILGGIAAGFLIMQAVSVASAIASAAAWAAANAPIILIGVAVAGLIALFIQMGVTFSDVGAVIGGIFGFIYAIGYNCFALLHNQIATFAEFFANVFNDPVAAVAHLFFDVFDNILSQVETVAGAIDALLGSNLSGAVAGFRSTLSEWVDTTFGENAIEIKRMSNLDVAQTSSMFSQEGANLGRKLDNFSVSLEDFTGGFEEMSAGLDLGGGGVNGGGTGDLPNVGKVGSVGKIENDVKLSDEDIKMYRDLAEQRYMNNIELKTLAPAITVNIPEGAGKNLTGEDVADRIKVMLIEQMNAQTAVAHG